MPIGIGYGIGLGSRRSVVGGSPSAPAPTVTSLDVASGPAVGGTALEVIGTGFVNGATVDFDGVPATGVVWNSATSLDATTPAGAAGAADVTVTNPDAQADTLPGGYTYVAAPVVTGVTPALGTTAGGTAVTVEGSGFVDVATVTFDGAPATGVDWISSTEIDCIAPAGAAGGADVVVTNPDAQTSGASGNGAFTYVAPATVSAISPKFGSKAGGTVVDITVDSSAGCTSASVGGVALTSFSIVNATTVRGTTGVHAATACDVIVTNGAGPSAALASAYFSCHPSDAGTLLFAAMYDESLITFDGSRISALAAALGTTVATSQVTAGKRPLRNLAAKNGRNTASFTQARVDQLTSTTAIDNDLDLGCTMMVVGKLISGATATYIPMSLGAARFEIRASNTTGFLSAVVTTSAAGAVDRRNAWGVITARVTYSATLDISWNKTQDATTSVAVGVTSASDETIVIGSRNNIATGDNDMIAALIWSANISNAARDEQVDLWTWYGGLP